jgi:hypothetical protein
MKSFSLFSIILILVLSFTSCTHKENHEQHSEEVKSEAWPQLDSFHTLMSEAFHPYKDSANLEPVKRLAEDMAKNAEEWVAAPLPEKVSNDDMQLKLQQLQAGTRILADKIKEGASDVEIGSLLQSLHDSFHGIMEMWNGEEEHEHEHND